MNTLTCRCVGERVLERVAWYGNSGSGAQFADACQLPVLFAAHAGPLIRTWAR